MHRIIRTVGFALALLLATVAITGCGARMPFVSAAAGTMRVQSLGEQPVSLSGRLRTSLYGDAADVETTFILADAPVERILSGEVVQGQIFHIELLWLPRAGWTPTSADATNASIRYIVISNGEVGVYAGAGFALPRGSIGSKNVTVTVQDASLRLVEHTPGFVDLLTPARLSGTFTADHDPRKTVQAHYAMSQIVTDALGRSMFVNGAAGEGAVGYRVSAVGSNHRE
jgi:hypothetical protein